MPAWPRTGAPLHLSAAGLAELLAGDDRPGEGYLAKAGRLTAARHQAEEIISHEYGPPAPEDEDDGDEYGEPIPAWDGRWSWAATTRRGRR